MHAPSRNPWTKPARCGLATIMLLAAGACEKSNAPKPSAAPTATPVSDAGNTDAPATASSGDTGSIVVTVKFVGAERPKRRLIKAQCAKPEQIKIPSETYIVSKKLAVRNVVVFVKDGFRGDFTAPTTPAKLDQVGCQYVPHVQSVMVGQPMTITNSDATLHNIHSFAKKQRTFNFAQPTKGMTRDVRFARPEFVKVKCDVHAWMSAYVAVFNHPFHAVTDKKGACTIENLPPGKYTIGAWHEQAGELATQEVTVEPGKTTNIEFALK